MKAFFKCGTQLLANMAFRALGINPELSNYNATSPNVLKWRTRMTWPVVAGGPRAVYSNYFVRTMDTVQVWVFGRTFCHILPIWQR